MSQKSQQLEQEAMSTAGLTSGDDTGVFFRKLVEMESRGHGDQERAIRSIARGCGLSFWTGYRLYSGETKDPKGSVIRRVRLFGLSVMERQLAAARRNYEEAKRLCDEADDRELADEVEILGAQVQSLSARVKAKKEALI